MMRFALPTLLAGALLLALPAVADAHGGAWRGPPRLTPGQRNPQDPTPPGTGPVTPGPGEATPLPSGPGSPTGPSGPLEGAPTPTRPRGGTNQKNPGLAHWTYWWSLNRERILDLRGLQTERLRARTPTASPFFFGKDPETEAPDTGPADARRAIVDALLAATRDDNADVASGAVIALGKAGDEEAVPRLEEIVNDDSVDRSVNESAALAIGMIGAGGSEVRGFLEGVMSDERRPRRTRAFAALGLGFLGDVGAIPALHARARTDESNRDVPACALLALGLLGEELVTPDLGRELSGPPGRRADDDVLRAYRAAALGMIRSPSAIPALLAALRDREEEVRRQAALSLGALTDRKDEEVLKALLYALATDRDDQVKAFAAVALGEIGAPEAGDALLHTYRKGTAIVVPYAAIGLGLLARNSGDSVVAERVTPFLRAQFGQKGSNDLRAALAIALGIARDETAAKPLRRALWTEGDPELRSHIAVALGLLGSDEAVPALQEALKDRGNPALQREAALALGLIGDGEAVKILTEQVRRGSSEYVRGSAAVALGRLATPATATALRELLEDSKAPATTRAFVAVALGLVLDRHAVPILSRIGDHLNHRMATEAVAEVLTLL